MQRTCELRELTANFVNPEYDGRTRYGLEHVKMFPSGSRFVVESCDDDEPVITFLQPHVMVTRRDAVAAVLAVSKPRVPQDFSEFLAANGEIGYTGHYASEILSRLFDNEATRPVVIAAFAAIQAAEMGTES